MWNSLKYEVRNGEVKETIDATLDVLRAIGRRLDGTSRHKLDVSLLRGYVDLVSRDCRDDIANPTYTKQAGLLWMTVISANIRSYLLYNAIYIDTIRQNVRQPKSPSHTRDLLLILNSLLKTRMELFRDRKQGHPDDEQDLKNESRAHLDSVFHDIYLPIWTSRAKEPLSEDKDVLKQVIQGLALIVSQQVLSPDGDAVLLCPSSVCSEICSLLTLTLTKSLSLSSNDNDADDTALEDEAVLALRTIVMNYTDGYAGVASRAKAEIAKRDWSNPSEYSLNALKNLLSRLAFIGCSEIPSRIATDAPSQIPFSPLQHFITLTASLLDMFPLSSQSNPSRPTGVEEDFLANAYVISSLHASIIWFREACEAKFGKEALVTYTTGDQNWVEEFGRLPEDWILQMYGGSGTPDAALSSLQENDPHVYRQFLRLSLFLVRYLYRTASSGPPEPWSERALVQLSRMAALVVRSLGETLQMSCNLAHEAFHFFSSSEKSSAQCDSLGLLPGLLTLGILQGLRPGAMTGLVRSPVPATQGLTNAVYQYAPGGIAEKLLCDTSNFGPSPSRESDVRAAIGMILANKYKGGPSTPDPESSTMRRVLDFWGNWIKEKTCLAPMDSNTFHASSTIAVNIIAGAAARQEKHVVGLVPSLHEAMASQHANGEMIAKSMGIIVKQSDFLSADNHAVVKRFYKQWAYSHLAKPLLDLAQPAAANTHAATRYRLAILSMAANCQFSIYQDDLEPLIRLLVTALSSHAGLSEEVAWTQTAWALEILVEILSHEPEALKGYLREIIRGTTEVYQKCSQKNATQGAPAAQTATRATCRKLALQVLGSIPTKFEERHLLSCSLPTQRMLAVACGDPVRKVREVARKARANWAKVG